MSVNLKTPEEEDDALLKTKEELKKILKIFEEGGTTLATEYEKRIRAAAATVKKLKAEKEKTASQKSKDYKIRLDDAKERTKKIHDKLTEIYTLQGRVKEE